MAARFIENPTERDHYDAWVARGGITWKDLRHHAVSAGDARLIAQCDEHLAERDNPPEIERAVDVRATEKRGK